MGAAMAKLSGLILTLQGNGDYQGVDALVKDQGTIKAELAKSLARLTAANIPVDIIFEQGADVLGIK